jgi:hypothetical protein
VDVEFRRGLMLVRQQPHTFHTGALLPRPNTALTGIAGVHHVVAELSRRGLVALPTIRNTTAYDIIVATPDGKRHANLQVKASQNRRSFFLMPPSTKVRARPHDYYVLLRWLANEDRYEGFMLSGQAARNEVRRSERLQRSRIRAGKRKSRVWPSILVGGKEVDRRAEKWRNTWLKWTL